MRAPRCGPGFPRLELLCQRQGREHLCLLISLPRHGAKGGAEGCGVKAVSRQHQKWGPMKIQQAEDSPPEKWREAGNELPAECGHGLFARDARIKIC